MERPNPSETAQSVLQSKGGSSSACTDLAIGQPTMAKSENIIPRDKINLRVCLFVIESQLMQSQPLNNFEKWPALPGTTCFLLVRSMMQPAGVKAQFSKTGAESNRRL